MAVGFCFGGLHAFLAAASPLGLAGVVGFYGALDGSRRGLPSPADVAAEMSGPVLGLFGGDDAAITPAQVAHFDERLEAAGVEHEIVTYPGAPHSFFDRKYAEYADACEDAWRRTLDFLQGIGERAAALPSRPRAAVAGSPGPLGQRAVVDGDVAHAEARERERVERGRDPAAAVGDDAAGVERAGRAEALAQLGGRAQAARAGVEQRRRVHVGAARDAARAPVAVDLAAVDLRCERVEHAGRRPAERGEHLVAAHEQARPRSRRERRRRGRRRGSALTGRPSATQASQPPSSTAAASKPQARSIHHSRVAHIMPLRS